MSEDAERKSASVGGADPLNSSSHRVGSSGDGALSANFLLRRRRRGTDVIDKSGNVTARNPTELDHRIAPPASMTADHAFEVFA